MKKFINFYKKLKGKKGYSLIEVIFVFIIIGVAFLIISKVKDDIFFSQNMNNTKQSIEYLAANIRGAYAGNKYSNLDTQRAIDMGVVPSVMTIRGGSKIEHPMKGELKIEKGSDNDTFIITLEGLSNEACLQLESSATDTWVDVDSSCGSDSKTNSISFESY